jgi:uncharacterized membrane protein YhaH (DUF805 family)
MTIEAAPAKPQEKGAGAASGFAKLVKPYLFVTAYYLVVAALVAAVLLVSPEVIRFLPIGGVADFGALGQSAFEPAAEEATKLALSMIASFLLMLPVTWICMGARRRKDVSQSFIQTILVLPMVITGIVHVVHDSLALAFSLAGIVAGVRFRHTLKDSAETTYLFTAIGVGVACGVNAVEIGAIISIFFNYAVLGLWASEFGSDAVGKQMFSREWMAKDDRGKGGRSDDDRDADDDD